MHFCTNLVSTLITTAQESMWINVRVPNKLPPCTFLIIQTESAVPIMSYVEVETVGEAECELLAPPRR